MGSGGKFFCFRLKREKARLFYKYFKLYDLKKNNKKRKEKKCFFLFKYIREFEFCVNKVKWV